MDIVVPRKQQTMQEVTVCNRLSWSYDCLISSCDLFLFLAYTQVSLVVSFPVHILQLVKLSLWDTLRS